MPIYQCAHQHGLLSGDMKAKIASAITDAHVDATGAPRVAHHHRPDRDRVRHHHGVRADPPSAGRQPQWFADNAEALDGISGTGL